MIAILHHYRTQKVLYGVRNISCDIDNHFCLEMLDATSHLEVVDELNKDGFKAKILGSLITVEITAFTIFEDERKKKEG